MHERHVMFACLRFLFVMILPENTHTHTRTHTHTFAHSKNTPAGVCWAVPAQQWPGEPIHADGTAGQEEGGCCGHGPVIEMKWLKVSSVSQMIQHVSQMWHVCISPSEITGDELV